MSGESPLSMMRPAPRRMQPRSAKPRRRRRPGRYIAAIVIVILVTIGWIWLWYYAASIADRTLSGWTDREAALGRIYRCGTQNIGGFPFGIIIGCQTASAQFNSNQPPFDVHAGGVTFSAEIYRPTRLAGDVTGPVTLANSGQPPVFVINWT